MSGLFQTDFREFYQQVKKYSQSTEIFNPNYSIRFRQPNFIISSTNSNVLGLYIYKNRLCYIKSWFPFESYILSILNEKGEITNKKILDTHISDNQYDLDELNLEEFTTLASRIETINYFKHFQCASAYILANGYYWFYVPSTDYRQFIVFTEKNFKLVGFTSPISYHSDDEEISISNNLCLGDKSIDFTELLNNFIYHNTTIQSDTLRSHNLKDQFTYDLITKPFYSQLPISIETSIKPPIYVSGFNLEKYICLLPNKNLIRISQSSPLLLYENGTLENETKTIMPANTHIYILPETKTVYDILRFYSRGTEIGNTLKEVVITMATKSDFLTTNSKDIIDIGERLDTKTRFCNYLTERNIKLDFENSEFIVLNNSTMPMFNDELVNYCISNGIVMFIPEIPNRYKDIENLFIIHYNEGLIDWEDSESIEKWMGFMAGIHDNLYNQRLPHMMEEYLRIAKGKNPLVTVLNYEKHYLG